MNNQEYLSESSGSDDPCMKNFCDIGDENMSVNEDEEPIFQDLQDVDNKLTAFLVKVEETFGEDGLNLVEKKLNKFKMKYSLQRELDYIINNTHFLPDFESMNRQSEAALAKTIISWYGECVDAEPKMKFLYWSKLWMMMVHPAVEWIPLGSPVANYIGWNKSKYHRILRALKRVDTLITVVGEGGICLVGEKLSFHDVEHMKREDWKKWLYSFKNDKDIAFMKSVKISRDSLQPHFN